MASQPVDRPFFSLNADDALSRLSEELGRFIVGRNSRTATQRRGAKPWGNEEIIRLLNALLVCKMDASTREISFTRIHRSLLYGWRFSRTLDSVRYKILYLCSHLDVLRALLPAAMAWKPDDFALEARLAHYFDDLG